MNLRALLLTSTLIVCPLALAGDNHRQRPDAARLTDHDLRRDCDETDDCIVDGLNLSNEQQLQVRDILQAAGKQQDELRDETVRRLQEVLTPEQSRQFEQHRADILAHRAQRLRQKARLMQQRARELKEAH